MEKTKIGITISLFGGGLYFLGIMGIIPLVAAAGYVLIAEENKWLRRVAVKAVAVVLFFAVLSACVGLLSDSSSFLNTLVVLFDGTINLSTFNRIISLVQTLLTILRTLILLLLGFRALKLGDVSVGPVDGAIKKGMDN